MLNSRKLSLALSLLAASAVSSFAQTCNGTVTSTPLALRPEGITEVLGDITITCAAGNPLPTTGLSILVTVQGTGTVAVTNTSTATSTATAGAATATGLINSVIPNSISFTFATIPAATQSLTISGMRVNASTLTPNTPVSAFLIMTTGASVLPINPNPTTVGYVLPASFSATVVGGTTFNAATLAGPSTFPACVTNSSISGAIRVVELFSGVLRVAGEEGPGASVGTQVQFAFSNLPAGVTILLPNAAITTGANTLTPASGVSTTAATGITTTYTAATGDTAYAGAFGAASASAIYTVTTSSINTVDTLFVPFIARFTGGPSIGTGTGTVQVTLAPLSSTTTVPRFAQTGPTLNLFTTAFCGTSLLFPYVTNVAGFDTGVAISNTTADPTVFATPNQTGTCTLNYYGDMSDGGALPSAATTSAIAAGRYAALTLSAGGSGVAAVRTGYTGYIIAQCNFQLAHGYAFISDLGARTIAHGYLALVLPANAGSRTAGANIETLNN